MPRARRTSRMRVIIDADSFEKRTFVVFSLSYRFADVASPRLRQGESGMGESERADRRQVDDRADARRPAAAAESIAARPARSLSVNLAESPLGWLYARGHVTERQCLAGERLAVGLGARPTRPERDDALGRGADAARARRARRCDRPVDLANRRARALRRRSRERRAGPGRYRVADRLRGRGACARPRPRSAGRRAPASSCSASRSTGSPIYRIR